MKKILILLFMIGAFTFVNVDLFASSHTTFYGYDLDTQYQELGNVSLREFFYDNNLNYKTFSNISPGVSIVNDYIYFETTTYATPYIFLSDGTTYLYFNSTNIYYINYSIDITDDTFFNYFILRNLSGTAIYDSGIKSYLNTIGGASLYLQFVSTQTGNTTATFNSNDFYIIDITSTGTQLSKARLDFLFNVYKTLYDRELAYDDGESDGLITGYNDGYSTGYDDGNLDGYSLGYDEGLFDYHTGNNYGSYDFTLSEPYDQATQANISLLNIFSMIIGVAMSMLGFIINIDIFGISIASILGTLAIGVSIVWLLKLIRG